MYVFSLRNLYIFHAVGELLIVYTLYYLFILITYSWITYILITYSAYITFIKAEWIRKSFGEFYHLSRCYANAYL